jgi:monothiol glutaredoxin
MKGTPETPQCGFSRASIQILGLQGVDPKKFTAYNVLEDEELRQGMLSQVRTLYFNASLEVLLCISVTTGRPTWEWQASLTNESIGIKEYSEWPTIPQLYVNKEFVGGCDILMSMHQDGSLAKMLEEKGVLVPAEEDAPAESK